MNIVDFTENVELVGFAVNGWIWLFVRYSGGQLLHVRKG
jgi:hypothetical protein